MREITRELVGTLVPYLTTNLSVAARGVREQDQLKVRRQVAQRRENSANANIQAVTLP